MLHERYLMLGKMLPKGNGTGEEEGENNIRSPLVMVTTVRKSGKLNWQDAT